MGDGLKLFKDKRHRSSSSLAGVVLEGTRSERKLDIRVSIPEVDDQFTIAEARCDDLQEKIDLVKGLKRKRKMKKRSMTRVADTPPLSENVPFISVRTQPKKKVSQQAARLRRVEVAPNPARGYLDPATVEQHQMIGQVRGYNKSFRPQSDQIKVARKPGSFIETQMDPKLRLRRTRADGDAMTSFEVYHGRGSQMSGEPLEVACGDDEDLVDFSDDTFDKIRNDSASGKRKDTLNQNTLPKHIAQRRRNLTRNLPSKEGYRKVEDKEDEVYDKMRVSTRPQKRRSLQKNTQQNDVSTALVEERPVVELFSKVPANNNIPQARARNHSPDKASYNHNLTREIHPDEMEDHATGPLHDGAPTEQKKVHRLQRRVRYRSRRYELPTVASQMKQAGMRYYYDSGKTSNIPFVVSKSTAPSHNIGVNIQQVLNGIKVQQPLSGIPPTIAHHMGLGHLPTHGARSTVVSLDNREINVIRVGQRQLRLPSYRYISYNRLLSLYREGDGMVPRFLRAMSRPHYFYTSMYNLATNREDGDAATSKGRAGSQEAKQSLAEYAALYKEYEQVDKCLKDKYDPELERRKDQLSRELAAREDHIRKVVQEYRSEVDTSNLRASASTADDAYRHSTYKLNAADEHQ